MPVRFTMEPILTARDLVSLQSVNSNDPRVLIGVLSTLIKKIVDWQAVAESIIVTNTNGRQIGEIGGRTISMLNSAQAGFTKTTIDFSSGALPSGGPVLTLPGSGTLRKIAIVVTSALTLTGSNPLGAYISGLGSASNLSIFTSAGVFADQVKNFAARIIGTGANIGDMVLLDNVGLEFTTGLSLRLDIVFGGGYSGTVDVYTWYDLA